MPTPTTHGPLPLVLGVTGHRDLRDADRPALEAQVRGVFTDLRERYPATPPLLLSSLAEGADRLAARVALECGARLVVPLPLPRDLYESDFSAPNSRQEFDDLLGRAEQVFELPLVAGNTADSVRSDGAARNRQYTAAGAYVARHCQVLLALWDGVASPLAGGTAEIVNFKLEGVPEPYAPHRNPLDPVGSGPVYHVLTPRDSSPQPAGTPGSLRKIFPQGPGSEAGSQAALDRIFRRMDTFNRDALRLGPAQAAQCAASQARLFPAADTQALPAGARPFLDRYAVADVLANRFRYLALGLLAVLLTLVFVAAFFYNTSELLPDALWGRVGYVAALAAAYLVYLWGKRHDYESKYLDYRALVEGLRVQFFWRLAGLPDSAADRYLRKQRTELDWIRDALRVWSMTLPVAAEERMPTVVDCWVRSQHAYYATAAGRNERRLRWVRLLSGLFLLLGLAWGAGKVFFGSVHEQINTGVASVILAGLLHGLVVIVSLSPVIAALLLAYGRTRALAEHAKQYARMAQLFARAEQRLGELLAVGKRDEAQALLRELGQEALAENGDWVQTHRERPIQIQSPR